MSVPITTLSAVTTNAWEIVSRSAAKVCGLVIVAQNCVHPPLDAWTTTADSGMSTSRLNHITATPRPSADGFDRVAARVFRRPPLAAVG